MVVGALLAGIMVIAGGILLGGGRDPGCRIDEVPLTGDFVAGEVTAGAETGSTRDAPATTGIVVRDWSVTIVGFCTSGPGVPGPYSLSGLMPIGGTLTGEGDEFYNFAFYPPTDDLTVLQLSAEDVPPLATIRFKAATKPNVCDVQGSAPGFRITRCGALLHAEWEAPIGVEADEIALIDVATFDGGRDGRPLGFYLLGLAEGSEGETVVTFAFQRPETGRLSLSIAEVALKDGSAITPQGDQWVTSVTLRNAGTDQPTPDLTTNRESRKPRLF